MLCNIYVTVSTTYGHIITYVYDGKSVERDQSSSSDVVSSPTLKCLFTGLSVVGSDNTVEMRLLLICLLFEAVRASYSAGNAWNNVDLEKISWSLLIYRSNERELNFRSDTSNLSQGFCAHFSRTKRIINVNSSARFHAGTSQKSRFEKDAFGNGCLCSFMNSNIASPKI